jgi:hypothetical protein
VLPLIERIVREQQHQCAWARIYEFNRNMCAATWAITGMTGHMKGHGRIYIPINKHCFSAYDVWNWNRWLGQW